MRRPGIRTGENTNGLLRQYLPKRSDLRAHSQRDLAAIAEELNERPRQLSTRNSAAGPARANATNASLSTSTGTSAGSPNRPVRPTERSCPRPHGRLIERTFGETRRRVKVIGRLPGERSCLSLVWAVLDRASRGWRGVVQTPANVRLLQQMRRDLLGPRTAHEPQPQPDEHDLPETVTPAA